MTVMIPETCLRSGLERTNATARESEDASGFSAFPAK